MFGCRACNAAVRLDPSAEARRSFLDDPTQLVTSRKLNFRPRDVRASVCLAPTLDTPIVPCSCRPESRQQVSERRWWWWSSSPCVLLAVLAGRGAARPHCFLVVCGRGVDGELMAASVERRTRNSSSSSSLSSLSPLSSSSSSSLPSSSLSSFSSSQVKQTSSTEENWIFRSFRSSTTLETRMSLPWIYYTTRRLNTWSRKGSHKLGFLASSWSLGMSQSFISRG